MATILHPWSCPACVSPLPKPVWLTVIAKSVETSAERLINLLCLNAPSVHSAVAILADEGTNTRHAVQELAERLLAPLAGEISTISVSVWAINSPDSPRDTRP